MGSKGAPLMDGCGWTEVEELRGRAAFAAEGASLIFSGGKDVLNSKILVWRLEVRIQSTKTGQGGQQMCGKG